MRILVVGAGGIGGYYGGRMLAAGRDVTFLVRPARAALLAERGLVVRSSQGDLDIANPPTVTADRLGTPYDLVVLSCKAYDLDGAMDSAAAAVGPDTMVLPLLNGMAQLERLSARFGAAKVLGGLCFISTTLDADGRILHLNDTHQMVFGEREGGHSPRAEAILAQFAGTGFDVRLSEAILQDMWEKWVFIATLAGITCLMRATIGDIAAAGGAGLASALLDECAAIAAGHGHAPSAEYLERSRTLVTQPGSAMAASMLRDLERGGPVEADHMIADMLARAGGRPSPLLGTALAHLKSYEARRAREAQAG